MAATTQASLLLQKQLRDLMKNPVDGFSAGLVDDSNVFEWNVTIIGPPDTLYDGGYFNAIMSFPSNYPNSPPSVRFTSEMWHPNVYSDGRVCISILHPPGDDPNGYELASERWTPVHTLPIIPPDDLVPHGLCRVSRCHESVPPRFGAPCRLSVTSPFRFDPCGINFECEPSCGPRQYILGSPPPSIFRLSSSIKCFSEIRCMCPKLLLLRPRKMNLPSNEGPMEQHDPTLASASLCPDLCQGKPRSRDDSLPLAFDPSSRGVVVESIVLSIISMLSSPNDESPANVEAAKEWRESRDEFKKKVSRIVRRSQEML
ncbi:unnamed protein product [Musa acuminata var. zebrina]